MEIKSHYEYTEDYIDIDESTWNLIFKIIVDKIGKKNVDNYNAWVAIENAIVEKFLDDEENAYISEYAEFIIPFERSFIVDEFSLANKCDAELLGYYSQLIKEDDTENMLIVLSYLGNKYNKYINYYDLFFYANYKYNLDKETLKNILIDLSSKYNDDLELLNALISAYASVLISMDQEKKGLTIFDNLIEEDPFNLLLQLRLIDSLNYFSKNEYLEKYYIQALNLAEELEEENIIELLRDELNDLYKDILKRPSPVNDSNLPTLIELINNPQENENLFRTILHVIYNIHPDLMDTIYYGYNVKEVNKANDHIYKSAYTINDIIENSDLKERFNKLLKDNNEHEALHIIMDEED